MNTDSSTGHSVAVASFDDEIVAEDVMIEEEDGKSVVAPVAEVD